MREDLIRESHSAPFDRISMFAVSLIIFPAESRAEIESTRTQTARLDPLIWQQRVAAITVTPWKLLLVFVVSSTTRDTAVRGGLLRFSRMKINARPHRRVAARRTDRVAVRRDISASRARAPCDSRAKNFGRTVDNKRSRRELQPVLVKITSPYDSRSSYGAHTRVIITGNDAAAHFGYSCFFQ